MAGRVVALPPTPGRTYLPARQRPVRDPRRPARNRGDPPAILGDSSAIAVESATILVDSAGILAGVRDCPPIVRSSSVRDVTTPPRSGFPDRIGIECPVVQAGMGGGVARAELAGAVSAAGGLGTVGMMAPRSFAAARGNAARLAAGRPVAANLLVPFIKPAHIHACAEGNAALVVLHGGLSRRWIARLRQRGLEVFVTVGTPRQAVQALAAHAGGLVVQGVEAGGHLLGVEPIERALPAVLEVAGSAPVLAAGSVADARDALGLLD